VTHCYPVYCVTVYPTVTPTPGNYEYVIATGCVSALLILLLGTMAILIYLLWYQHRQGEQAPYRHDESQEMIAMSSAAYTTTPPSSSFTSGTTYASKPAELTAAKYTESMGLTAAQRSGSCSSLSMVSKKNYSQHSVI